MIRTPKTLSITMAVDDVFKWPVEGSECRILSMTAGTYLEVAFDNDGYQRFYAGVGYPIRRGEQFRLVRFHNTTGGAVTIVATVSDAPLQDSRFDQTILGTINDALDLMTPPENQASIVPAAIAQTGVGDDQIFAARTGRKATWFEAPAGNTGAVYLGFGAGPITAANCVRIMSPRATWWPVVPFEIRASSENGTEVLHGYEAW